ncbi:hypothetical protein GCM10009628_20180 [Paeniglutamicibacter kerguelensis]
MPAIDSVTCHPMPHTTVTAAVTMNHLTSTGRNVVLLMYPLHMLMTAAPMKIAAIPCNNAAVPSNHRVLAARPWTSTRAWVKPPEIT